MTAQAATQLIEAREGAITPGATAVARAARALAAGGLVAFPTETVYGLGADATNGAAVARVYEAKGRPSFNPLIAHVADAAAARALARFPPAAQRLASAFLPVPLTLVLPKLADCPVAELATAGLDTIAVLVPSHPLAGAILLAFDRAARAGRPARAHRADRRRRAQAHGPGIDHRRLPRSPGAAAARRLAAGGHRARGGAGRGAASCRVT